MLVRTAVENKYSGYDESSLQSLCEQEWQRLKSNTIAAIPELIEPVDDVATDVRNQLACLIMMYNTQWSAPLKLAQLHRWLYGQSPEQSLRNSNTVRDFNERIRVDHQELPARINELERVINSLSRPLADARVEAQSAFLALVYASVIRIHPFVDGNGRVARMLVQQIRMWWNQPLLLIPKVRNSETWKTAIAQSLDDDFDPLIACLNRATVLR